MGIHRRSSASLLLIVLSSILLHSPVLADKKSYIVYLGGHSHSPEEISLLTDERARDTHVKLLSSVLGSEEKAKDAIFYSYTKYINGFAAVLDEEHVKELANYPGVVSVFPNRGVKLHTTHSWEFLNLERAGKVHQKSLWKKARYGEDTIIGNIDSGVWPESQSFKDDGLGPVPEKWRGICQNENDPEFTCNRKIIGARYFITGYEADVGKQNASIHTPRDVVGHGSHTLSTAGGRFVPSVSVFGYGNGTAKGGSSRARVAAYKVCWEPIKGNECYDADILSGFDAAIHDGVDVLSASIGGDADNYFNDGVAIGSFHAVKNGITVVASGGNSGPNPSSVSNVAPWILTVGASTIDRDFTSFFSFGKKKVKGRSLSTTGLPKKLYPIITSEDARAVNVSIRQAQLCALDSLDPEKAKGKIVVCLRGINNRVEKGVAVLVAGGVGMVLANDASDGNEIIADDHVLPATHITYSDGLTVYSYLKSTKSPQGYITLPKAEIGIKPAPLMADFSSQGPNPINPEVLKPDITGPGVNIIAAYSEATSPTPYASLSGTSMACPHVSGVVGLLKTLHPDWSPSAIRSAIMTTALVQDNTREPIENSSFVSATPFSYGSGPVHPNRAADPGLVYDLSASDYLDFLCALGYNSTQFAHFNSPYPCPKEVLKLEDFNYPSITVPNLSGHATVTRTVKNVGKPGTYKAHVKAPRGIRVSVKPKILEFKSVGEEKTFEVKLEAKSPNAAKHHVYGRLLWTDGQHNVRSPLVVKARDRMES